MTWLGELRISEGRLDGDEVRQRLLERWETDAG
jgi:hypothetical protein